MLLYQEKGLSNVKNPKHCFDCEEAKEMDFHRDIFDQNVRLFEKHQAFIPCWGKGLGNELGRNLTKAKNSR